MIIKTAYSTQATYIRINFLTVLFILIKTVSYVIVKHGFSLNKNNIFAYYPSDFTGYSSRIFR